MDQQSYNAAFLGLLITVLVIAFFLFIVRMLALTRQRGSTELDLALLARGLAVLCDAVGDMLFWLSVLLGLYWLFFFKRQEKLNVLLPSVLEDVKLLNIVITAAVCKTVRICELIYTQTQGSTAFLIDWEKSKGRILGRKMVAPPKDDNDNKDGPSVPAPGTNPYEPAPISVWRTLFVANEWNEIQAVRYTSLPLSLFVLLFLLEGLSWVGYTSPNPALTAEESRLYAANDASVGSLRFGLFVALWLCLEILFASFKYVIQRRWISDELQSFVDLLSVSNVSMLIFVEECFGYYIHGRTVHTYADCNMTGLHDNLKREEDGLTGTRGLEPNSDVQVFEVYCTREFREQYDRIFTFLVDQDLEERSDRGGIPGIRTLRVNTPQEKSIVAHHTISKFLSAFIDNTQPDFTYSVRTHSDALTSLLRRWLPSDMSYSKESVFFGTGTSQFGQALFLGREYDLFVWNVCVFGMLDLLVQNFYVAALVCYLTNLVAVMARSYIGSRTISRRSLIDSRFLL
jgi:meckelin